MSAEQTKVRDLASLRDVRQVTDSNEVLELLPYCKTRWGSWNGVITRLLILKKAVKLFTSTADDSDDVPNVDKGQPTYSSYRLDDCEWELLGLIKEVLAAAAEIQEAFSAKYYPTIWRILPLYEDFIVKWHSFAADPNMAVLRPALEAGIESLKKYYNKTDNSPVHIVSMYLNPCVKDEYFKVVWSDEGQTQARIVMEQVFDKYEKLYTSQQTVDRLSNAGRSAPSAVSRTSSSSLIARATESRRTREQLSTKVARAELKVFLAEDLVAVDESSSPEQQASSIFSWWKAVLLGGNKGSFRPGFYVMGNHAERPSSHEHPRSIFDM
ncbi:ribonuclease H-like domain-containing protein [Suillus tomentosus]|nr:ribonuclease H-like domain-containing protein [Suillus tomentosus]